MSLLKQVLHYSSITDFPTTGAANVLYIDDSQTYGKNYYWDGTGYKKTLGDILQFPYSNSLFPDLTTIGLALNYLLTPSLSVSLIVSPTIFYAEGLYDVEFTWVMSKDVSNISTIAITANTSFPAFPSLKPLTTGTVGSCTVTGRLTGTIIFTITVTDTSGNVATNTETITLSSAQTAITSFSISPTSWNQRVDLVSVDDENVIDYTLSWQVAVEKEYITTLKLYQYIGGFWQPTAGTDVLPNTITGGSGTLTISDAYIAADVRYKLVATGGDGTEYSKETTLQYIPYVPVEFTTRPTVSPSGTSGTEETFTFSAVINKNKDVMVGGSYLRLYQLDGDGGSKVSGGGVLSEFVEGGQDYVDLWDWLLEDTLIAEFDLTVPENTYFTIEVGDVDAYGNSSDDDGQMLVDYSTGVILSGFTLTPSKGYDSTSEIRTFVAEANTNVPINSVNVSLANVEYLRIEFASTNTADSFNVTIPEEEYNSVLNTLSYEFSKAINNLGVAGDYDVTLKFKEIGEAEISSNTVKYYVYDEVAIENVLLTYVGSTFTARVTLNKILDGTISQFRYKVNSGGSYSLITSYTTSTTTGVTVLTFTPSIPVPTGTIDFYVDITESLGVAGGSLTSYSEFMIDDQAIGENPVFIGAITQAEIEAAGYIFPDETNPSNSFEELSAILTSAYIGADDNIVIKTGDNGYVSETNPLLKWNNILSLGSFAYQWAAFPTTNPEFDVFNQISDASFLEYETLSGYFYSGEFPVTVGGVSVTYTVYVKSIRAVPSNMYFRKV